MRRFSQIIIFLILVSFIPLAGCHTSRKTSGKVSRHISFKGAPSTKAINKAIKSRYINFQTLSARLHVDFDNGKEHYNNVTVYLRMKKDSAIWLSVRPVLGIEMARLLLTKDSIKLRNNLKNEVTKRSADELEDLLHIPFDFSIIEDLLIGNPVFLPSDANDFQIDVDHISLILQKQSFTGKYQWSKDPFLLQKGYFQKEGQSPYAEQEFLAYKLFNIGEFSMKRNIKIQNSTRTEINLSFDKIAFNKPVQFPFAAN